MKLARSDYYNCNYYVDVAGWHPTKLSKKKTLDLYRNKMKQNERERERKKTSYSFCGSSSLSSKQKSYRRREKLGTKKLVYLINNGNILLRYNITWLPFVISLKSEKKAFIYTDKQQKIMTSKGRVSSDKPTSKTNKRYVKNTKSKRKRLPSWCWWKFGATFTTILCLIRSTFCYLALQNLRCTHLHQILHLEYNLYNNLHYIRALNLQFTSFVGKGSSIPTYSPLFVSHPQ